MDNIDNIKFYPITIENKPSLSKEISRMANLSKDRGYMIEQENWLLTKQEVYDQIS